MRQLSTKPGDFAYEGVTTKNEKMTKPKILVIGAGPTGLTAALCFARKGIIVDIIEKKEHPSEFSKAVGIMPETLDKLGKSIKGKILEEGYAFRKIRLHVDRKIVLSLDASHKLGESEVMIGLPQNRTEEIIAEELKEFGVKIGYGTKLCKVTTTDKFAEAWFEGEEAGKRYDWIIACDGVNSTARTQLKIPYLGYDLKEVWSIADIELKGQNDAETINVWVKLGKNNDVIISLPIGKNRYRLVSSTENCIKTLPLPVEIARIRREGTFKLAARQAEKYKVGRVLLAGDAAHCHSPVGGKGMNLGIDDAVAAVKAVVENKTEQYSIERHKIGKEVIKTTESNRKRIMSDNRLSKPLLKLVFGLIDKVEFFQIKVIKALSRLM